MKHFKENSAEFLIKVFLLRIYNLTEFCNERFLCILVNSLKESIHPNTEKTKGKSLLEHVDIFRAFS